MQAYCDRTGSTFGFGLGRIHHVLSSAERERIVLTAYDVGCRHFDLAAAYGDGLCEAEAGRILGTRRSTLRLATKFGIPASNLGGRNIPLYFLGKAARKVFSSSYGSEYGLRDFSPEAAIISVEQSLKRLRTDYIDYLFFHEPRHARDIDAVEKAVETMERLKRDGKIGHYGISSQTSVLLESARHGIHSGDAVQFELSEDSGKLLDGLPNGDFLSSFGIIRHLKTASSATRLDYGQVLTWFRRNYPGVMPILASNRPREIEKLGKAASTLTRVPAP